MTEDERQAANFLREILRQAPAIAETLLGFPWLADGVTGEERNALYNFREILRQAPAIAETLLGFPWLADGVTGEERNALYNLREILQEDPAVAETLLSFPWLADGVSEDEMYVSGNLRLISQEDPAAAKTLLGFPWLADGVTRDESHAVYNFRVILQEDPATAEGLLSFPSLADWLSDGLTEGERDAVYRLREILREAPATAKTLLGFPWLADGLTENESRAVSDLQVILREDPTMAETLLGFQWLADGVSWDDMGILRGLSRLYVIDRASLSALAAKPWFKDGLGREEFMLVGDLGVIANRSQTDALAIIGMPFLETLEPADALAVASLEMLASCWRCPADEIPGEGVHRRFRRVMAHPAISDGISDEEAKIVATLHSVVKFSPGLEDILLAPERITLEERTINLPLAGETQLTVIRTRPGAERTMDFLEQVVRTVEEFMAYPLPGGHIIYLSLSEDASYPWREHAYNYLTHMVGPPRFDTEEFSEATIRAVFAHEVHHYYFYPGRPSGWISEGGANFLKAVQANVSVGRPFFPTLPPCAYASNFSELYSLDFEGDDPAGICPYSSGERVWHDLYRGLGEPVFRQGFGNLYQMMLQGPGECGDDRPDICHVAAAFKAAAPADAAAIVDRIIASHFYGTEPYDTSYLDTGPVAPNLPGSIEITWAYISLDEDRPEETRTDRFSASEVRERVYLHLHLSSRTVQQARQLPLTFVEYFEDGFAYKNINITYTLNTGWNRTSLSFRVGPWADFEWAPGRYWVYAYHEGRKVAEVEFQVTP